VRRQARVITDYGYANIKRASRERKEEDELARRIDAMFARVEDPANLIAALHCPPRGTELDQAGGTTRSAR